MEIHPVAKTLQKKIPEKLREFLRQAILTVYAPAGSVMIYAARPPDIHQESGRLFLHRVFVTSKCCSRSKLQSHQSGNAPEALAVVQREWLVQLRDGEGPKFDAVKDAIKGRGGLAKAVNLAGPFIMSSQGKP